MVRNTRVPEIMDTLIALIGADPDIDPVAVIDGARSAMDYRDYIIFVGFRPNSEEFVTSERSAPQGYRANDQETINVGWEIAAKDAADRMKLARDRAAAKVAVLERIVTADMTLGLGKGVTATMGSVSWLFTHTDKGAECIITGDITVDVLL